MSWKPGYMHWAKTHPRVRFELTDSGIPAADLELIGARLDDVEFEVNGTYGDPRFIEAIAKRYDVPAECVVPVPGASCGNFVALAAVLERGDTVIVEQPVYDPITRVAEFLDLNIVTLPRRPNRAFAVDSGVDQVIGETSDRIGALTVTNLHNPSGRYESSHVMGCLAGWCRERDAHLIVDEAYLDGAGLIAGRPMETAARIGANVVTVNSLTKIYGLSGLRAGWVIAEPTIAEQSRAVMDILSVNNAAPSASLAVRALENLDILNDRYRRIHKRGQRVYRQWLSGQPCVRGFENHGGLFELIELPEGISAKRLCERLRDHYDTQVTPGDFFGLSQHVRLSLTLREDELSEALDRIGQALLSFPC